jgi:hypothetical protein
MYNVLYILPYARGESGAGSKRHGVACSSPLCARGATLYNALRAPVRPAMGSKLPEVAALEPEQQSYFLGENLSRDRFSKARAVVNRDAVSGTSLETPLSCLNTIRVSSAAVSRIPSFAGLPCAEPAFWQKNPSPVERSTGWSTSIPTVTGCHKMCNFALLE